MGTNDSASALKQTQNQLAIDIPENLETALSEKFCIYKVPPTLRKINPAAYTPQLISIGPIHHGRKQLQDMEIQKLRYFKEFCKRGKKVSPRIKEKEFSSNLLNQIVEEEIRGCYAVTVTLSSTELVNMILLDSVFILELFLRINKLKDYPTDFIIGKPWLRTNVQLDLIKLENQLPFAILEKLYNFAKKYFVNEQEYPSSFLELTCNYFSNFKPKKTKTPNPNMMLHFTDLVRYFWSFEHPFEHPENTTETESVEKPSSITKPYSITKLHQAGLKLMPAGKKSLLDINFKSSTSSLSRAELQLPCFIIDDTTEFVVRNLMALEQCHYPYETYICNYIRLLDRLIDTIEDVDLLVKKKIIVNGLEDSATVANLVNKLCNQITEVRSCYNNLSLDLNGYYDNWCNHTLAKLRSVYFGDLWRGTGTVAAIVLLVLTLIQTICSVLGL